MELKTIKYNGKERQIIVAKDSDKYLEGIDLSAIKDDKLRESLYFACSKLIVKLTKEGKSEVSLYDQEGPYEQWKPALSGWRKFLKEKIEVEDGSTSAV